MKKMLFSMPYLPQASANHSHTRSRHTGQPILKKEAAQWKNVLRQMVTVWIDEENIQLDPDKQVIIRLFARFPRKRGQKPDGDNFLKLAQDAIAEGFGVGQRGDYRFLARVQSVSHDDRVGELIYEVTPNVPQKNQTP